VEIQTEITTKDLNFINDVDLRNILLERLDELDRVFLVNANYSTIFLAISSVEGIFKHLSTIFRTEITKSPTYPLDSSGKHKEFDALTIEELYKLLTELNILPSITRFEHVYNLFRDYRNFIHPQAHTKKGWQIGLGQAQMALGLLNATIRDLAQYIFIDKEVFLKIAGIPDYDSSKVLHLRTHASSPLHSFVVLNRNVSDTLSLSFDLELPRRSIFNFVFNFKDEGDFKMLRLDNRERWKNCVLHCTQKYSWKEILSAYPAHPPGTGPMPVVIKVDFPNQVFSLDVNGVSYSFKDHQGNDTNLFNEISPNLKIGFFNEEGTVKLSNICL
jgi:hypothetical protein